jgi:ABC-type multidrug transport system ATPase subunit
LTGFWQNLQQRLTGRTESRVLAGSEEVVDGVLQLFALVAGAPGRGSAEELVYVRRFLERVDASAVERFLKRFEQVRSRVLPQDRVLATLRSRFSYDHRLLLLLKTWELLDVRAVTDAQRATLGAVAAGLAIEGPDASLIALLFAPHPVLAPLPTATVRFFSAGSRGAVDAGVPLPGEGLRLDFVQLGSLVYVRQRPLAGAGAPPPVLIGRRPLAPDFFTRLEPNRSLRAPTCQLLYRDVMFYLRHADASQSGAPVFLVLEGGAYRISGERLLGSRLQILASSAGLLVEPMMEARLEVNGERATTLARVSLSDRLVLDREPLNLREVAAAMEGRLGAESFGVRSVAYHFPDGSDGLDDVTIEARHGELVCILGPSGSGKSTLLSLMNGTLAPERGAVLFGGRDLAETPELRSRIGYVPQDDLLFENLTVEENLRFGADLRFAGRMPAAEIERRVARAIEETRLVEQRAARVGDPLAKVLSGGERKRLNIGLELLADVDVLLLDEPTSGLSSQDAERIIQLLKRRSLAGQIVIAVAHQPSARLLAAFDRLVLVDRGGKLAFEGSVPDALAYFQRAAPEFSQALCQACGQFDPDTLLGALETPQLGIDGMPSTARRFPPEYWQQRFREEQSRQPATTRPTATSHTPPPPPRPVPGPFRRFVTLLSRDWHNRWRNRSNLATTFLGAPALGTLIAWALHAADYARNSLYSHYLFLTVIVVLFFALSGSITEFIRDRGVMMREALLGVPSWCYLAAKLVNLTAFSLVQMVFYLGASFAVLQPEPVLVPYAGWLLLVALATTASGLFFSTLPGLSEKAATNLVPILLIPQILFAGSEVFPFERMRHLAWPRSASENADASATPPIAQLMISRWAYDGLLATHARATLVHRELELHRQLVAGTASIQTLTSAAMLLGQALPGGDATSAASVRALQQALGERIRATLHPQLWTEIREHQARPRMAWLDRRYPPLTVDALVLVTVTIGFAGLSLVSLRFARSR